MYHYSFGSQRGCEQKFISTDFVFLSRRSACHQQRRRGGNKRERPPGSGPPPHAPAERSCRRSLLSIHTISDSLAGQRTKECFPLLFCIWNADGTYRRASSYCGRRVMNSVLRTEGATAAAAEATLGTSKQLWKRMEFLFFLFLMAFRFGENRTVRLCTSRLGGGGGFNLVSLFQQTRMFYNRRGVPLERTRRKKENKKFLYLKQQQRTFFSIACVNFFVEPPEVDGRSSISHATSE